MDGKHIQYFFQTLDGRDSQIMTFIRHGMQSTTIGDSLLGKMARQLHLTKSQFLELVDCTLDEAGYREILKTQGLAV